jgi:hypothetical protein
MMSNNEIAVLNERQSLRQSRIPADWGGRLQKHLSSRFVVDCVLNALAFAGDLPRDVAEYNAGIANFTRRGVSPDQIVRYLSSGSYESRLTRLAFITPAMGIPMESVFRDLKDDHTTMIGMNFGKGGHAANVVRMGGKLYGYDPQQETFHENITEWLASNSATCMNVFLVSSKRVHTRGGRYEVRKVYVEEKVKRVRYNDDGQQQDGWQQDGWQQDGWQQGQQGQQGQQDGWQQGQQDGWQPLWKKAGLERRRIKRQEKRSSSSQPLIKVEPNVVVD